MILLIESIILTIFANIYLNDAKKLVIRLNKVYDQL